MGELFFLFTIESPLPINSINYIKPIFKNSLSIPYVSNHKSRHIFIDCLAVNTYVPTCFLRHSIRAGVPMSPWDSNSPQGEGLLPLPIHSFQTLELKQSKKQGKGGSKRRNSNRGLKDKWKLFSVQVLRPPHRCIAIEL